MPKIKARLILTALICCAVAACSLASQNAVVAADQSSSWMLVDDFESGSSLKGWTNIDLQNETKPFIPNPQIAEVRAEAGVSNHY